MSSAALVAECATRSARRATWRQRPASSRGVARALTRQLATALGIALATLLLAPPASAWEPVDECRPVWDTQPSEYRVHESGYDEVPMAQLREVLAASFDAWATACPAGGFRAVDAGLTSQGALVPSDTLHVIEFRQQPWPAELGEPSVVFATTLTRYSTTGAVCSNLRADMLFNANAHRFVVDAAAVGPDLQTVATHEAGHWLGLDHSSVRQSTMWFEYAGRDQRTLHQDDQAGVDALYPPDCPCARDADCGEREICDRGECIPRPCATEADCANGLVCDVATGACEPPPCQTDGDCLGDQRCEPISGDCVPTRACPTCRPCETVDDCGGQPYQCVAGLVGQRVCTQLCSSSRDCPGDGACFTVDQQPFSICLNATAEVAGICPADYTCTPRPCDITPCAVDELCNEDGVCAPIGGEDGCIICDACENDIDCPGGSCWSFGGAQVCSTSCSGDADCPAGTACQVFSVGDASEQLCLNPIDGGEGPCPANFICGASVPEPAREGSAGGCAAASVGPWWGMWCGVWAVALFVRRRR